MVERLLLLKNGDLNDEITEGNLSKSQSFNTEDDDDSVANESIQQGEDDSPQTSKPNIYLLSPDENKRRLLLLTSPSMDSINDPEGSVSDIPSTEKVKKKKRRTIERPDILQLRKSMKKNPWYTRIDYEIFIKPLVGIAVLILLYLAWVKRDVWIPRLLTSKTRIRHTISRNEEKLSEREELPTTNKNSSLSSNEDDIIVDNDKNNNDQSSTGDNDDDNTPTTYTKHPSQKINIRIRRNKMSFSKDRQAKKRHGSKYRLVGDGDDDDVDIDDDDDDNIDTDSIDENDDDDNVQETDKDNDEIVIKPVKVKETVSSSSKKRHHRHHNQEHQYRTNPSREKKSKTNIILRSHDDIVDQLHKLLKSHGKTGDLSTLLIKQTGLTKSKINRFIHEKDFSIITLDQIISVLNHFHSTLLIVSK